MIDSIFIDELLSLFLRCVEETLGGFALTLVFPESVRVDSFFANEAAVSFSNSNKDCALLNEKFGSPVSYVSKALNDKLFASKTLSHSQFSKLVFIGEDLPCSVVHSQARCLFPATDSVVFDALSSGNSSVVDISSTV